MSMAVTPARPRRRRAVRSSIGLVNNMPDAALQVTERQFRELLIARRRTARGVAAVFSLPEVPRSRDAGRQYVAEHHEPVARLWDGRSRRADRHRHRAARRPDLTDEPYWPALARLVDWADGAHDFERLVVPCRACRGASPRRHRPARARQQAVRRLRLRQGRRSPARRPPARALAQCRIRATTSCRRSDSPRTAISILSRSHGRRRRSLHQAADKACSSSCRATRNTMPTCPASANTAAMSAAFSPARREQYPEMPRGYFDDAATAGIAGVPRAGAAATRHRAARAVPRSRRGAASWPRPGARPQHGSTRTGSAISPRKPGAPARRGRRPSCRRPGAPPNPTLRLSMARDRCAAAGGGSRRARRCSQPRDEREQWDDLLTQELLAAGDARSLAARSRRRSISRRSAASSPASISARREPFGETVGLDRRAAGARRRPHDASALFRAVQPGADLSGAMRRPHRRRVQPAARDRDDLAGRGRDRGACHPRGRAARRSAAGDGRPFHHRRRRGELHRADLRADPGRAAISPTSGARAFAGAPVFYVSRESHLAWLKIAHQAGIGRAAVRLVATDGSGRHGPARARRDDRRRPRRRAASR